MRGVPEKNHSEGYPLELKNRSEDMTLQLSTCAACASPWIHPHYNQKKKGKLFDLFLFFFFFLPQQLFHPSDSLSPFLFWFPLEFRYLLLCVCRESGVSRTTSTTYPVHFCDEDSQWACMLSHTHFCSEGCWVNGSLYVCLQTTSISLHDWGTPRRQSPLSRTLHSICLM